MVSCLSEMEKVTLTDGSGKRKSKIRKTKKLFACKRCHVYIAEQLDQSRLGLLKNVEDIRHWNLQEITSRKKKANTAEKQGSSAF